MKGNDRLLLCQRSYVEWSPLTLILLFAQDRLLSPVRGGEGNSMVDQRYMLEGPLVPSPGKATNPKFPRWDSSSIPLSPLGEGDGEGSLTSLTRSA